MSNRRIKKVKLSYENLDRLVKAESITHGFIDPATYERIRELAGLTKRSVLFTRGVQSDTPVNFRGLRFNGKLIVPALALSGTGRFWLFNKNQPLGCVEIT